jgi:hypothetical protein
MTLKDWIIVGVVGLLVLFGLYFFYANIELNKFPYNNSSTKCNGLYPINCDKGCNVESDCALGPNCNCYNKKDIDRLFYDDKGGRLAFEQCAEEVCTCQDNTCIIKKCSSNNLGLCDKSCNVDSDCKLGQDCRCYNNKDINKTLYDNKGNRTYLDDVCEINRACGCNKSKCEIIYTPWKL